MSAKNPTPDDLRTIARNMASEEGSTSSRAEIIANAADALEAANGRLARMYDNASILRLMDEVEIRHGVDEDRWGILRRMIGEE